MERRRDVSPIFEAAASAFTAEQRPRLAALASLGYLTVDEASRAQVDLKFFVTNEREHNRTPLPKVTEWAKR